MTNSERDIAYQIDCHVGSKIRERRAILGLSQQDIAKSLDISYQQLQKYETGGNRVSAGKLYLIGNLLGVDVSYFFDDIKGTSGKNAQTGLSNENEAEIRQLSKVYSSIKSPEIKKAVMRFLKEMSKEA